MANSEYMKPISTNWVKEGQTVTQHTSNAKTARVWKRFPVADRRLGITVPAPVLHSVPQKILLVQNILSQNVLPYNMVFLQNILSQNGRLEIL